MGDTDKLINAVAGWFANNVTTPTITELRCMVGAFAKNCGTTFAPEELASVVATLETKYTTTMDVGAFFSGADYKPWLDSARSGIDFYYWGRYHALASEMFPKEIVPQMDLITDKILDHLEDPKKEGGWERRGLIVGYVQSGKTANYTALIAKAADAGYKVIVVLGGMLNSLRNQTQARIDSDFSGFCTRRRECIGVARFGAKRRPVNLTTVTEDFKKGFASQAALELKSLAEPVVLVIKKNVTTLRNLREWLTVNNPHGLMSAPLLLIDDEADNASINTNKEDQDPTKINLGIRELLHLFPRSSFVGYTATPFANIFIDPDTKDEMLNGKEYRDLFPKDFIYSLDAPSNYFGAKEVFNDDAAYVRDIDDNEDLLPLKHKKGFEPIQLPDSAKRAIDCFLLTKTIRLLRGQTGKHHSMMINASRFTGVQERIKSLVVLFVKDRQDAIRNYCRLSEVEALQNHVLCEIKTVFDSEYANAGFDWGSIQPRLNEAVGCISVISVNTISVDSLDYSSTNWPGGRSVIAVGGVALSRGLTLEGLSVSYALRNSVTYDTILQMGRWFGYRDGYKDLCRVFLQPKMASFYAHISEAVEELRGEFREMDRLNLTPVEFGLKVREHPAALEVTSCNKMRSSETIVREIALAGRFAETSRILNTTEALLANKTVLENVVEECLKFSVETPHDLGFFWSDAPLSIAKQMVQSFKNAPDCLLTDERLLLNYLNKMEQESGNSKCDILLRSNKQKIQQGSKEEKVAGLPIITLSRVLEDADIDGDRITFRKRHITGKGDERAGIPKEIVEQIDARVGGKNVPDWEYRKHKAEQGMNPLLILVIASVHGRKDEARTKTVYAYGISFPGDPKNRSTMRTVTYAVNTVWLRRAVDWSDVSDDDRDETEDEE